MSYATIEAAAQTLLQALSNFADADVTRADWRVLDSGSAPYAVLYPGPFEIDEAGDYAEKHIRWTLFCEVYERYQDGGTSETALEATRQAVIDCLLANPTLGGTAGVTMVLPRRAEVLQYVNDADGGGPYFVMQRIAVEVDEYVNRDGSGEFA